MVERNKHSTDQRIRTVRLTFAGKVALEKLAPTVNELYNNLVQGVSHDDLDTCVQVLGTLLKNVKNNEIRLVRLNVNWATRPKTVTRLRPREPS